MNKDWFNVKTNSIEVPEEELYLAIDKGIVKGRKLKKYKKHTKILASLTSIAASLLLALGFVFSPMTKVMASMPIIGSIYEYIDLKMGRQLESNNLITELNETASDNGVNITLTSVYYDGIYIGITFKTDGLNLTDEELEYMEGSTFDYYLYMEDGVKVGWTGGGSRLQKVDNYYIGAIELQYPDKEFPKDFNLPITFERIGNIEGKWQFEVPVTQLPTKKYKIENNTTKDEKYSFTLESMTIGETNIRINYQSTIPDDLLDFRIYDDKGKELAYDTIQSLGFGSAEFQASVSDSKYLLIYPMYRVNREFIKLEPVKVNIQDN